MTGVLAPAEPNLLLAAAAVRIVREMELMRLLEAAAHRTRESYGATHLVVDRATDPETADIKAAIDGVGLVDLWDLNPILWGDAHWAAMRFVPAGQISIVGPLPHRD